ncbi:class I SAM-dependent methyltransferase [Marinovum sp.]|uniref:class I SAM-dependent methyltransferase n=1 Tax=Marinovum sp. TaxID=2024839 RepID=UPI003A8EB60E
MSNRATHDIWNGQSGADWAQHQRDLDLFLAGSMARLAELLPLAPGARVLEIGSGAGSFSLDLARAVTPGGEVLGLDISDPLLALARRRAEGQAGLAFRKLDIQTEPLDAGGFDICTAHLGMMFFSDPVLALSRIRTRLAPGAVIAFNGWAGRDNPWFSIPLGVAERHLGPMPPSPPSKTPPPGPLAFSDVIYVTGLLREAGYHDPQGWQETFSIRHPGGLNAVMQTLSYVGPISTLYRLKQPDAAQRSRIADEIREAFAPFIDSTGALDMPGTLSFYQATAS